MLPAVNPRILLLPLALAPALVQAADDDRAPADFQELSTAERLGIHYDLTAPQTGPDLPAPPPGLLRMPSLVVHEDRHKLTDRAVMTEKEELRLARKTSLSPLFQVTFGPLAQLAEYLQNPLALFTGWHPGDAEALTLARQERRLQERKELGDLLELEGSSNPKFKAEFGLLRYQATVPR
jgi:hypothetical protein